MKKITLLLLLLIAASFIMAACDDESTEENLRGYWRMSSYAINGTQVTFTDEVQYFDGTIRYRYKGNDTAGYKKCSTWDVTYRIDGDKIRMSNENDPYTYKITDDNMTITKTEEAVSLTQEYKFSRIPVSTGETIANSAVEDCSTRNEIDILLESFCKPE